MAEGTSAGDETGPLHDLDIAVEHAPETARVLGDLRVDSEPLSLAALPGLGGIPIVLTHRDTVVHPGRERYHEVITALKDAGFDMCVDLCAVDYLEHPDRRLPEGVARERFEIVVGLLSLEHRTRVRVRVQVPADDPAVPTLFDLYPGTENMEREAFDMFGVLFTDHPDMTRILMPEDWEGHPLRKDYSVGRVPVHFKEAPGPR
jgi:NADH-quinone oxidoreductase subunit C